jgi:modulator of FtsH protease
MIKKYNNKFSLQNLFNIINQKKTFLLQIFTNLIFQILVTFVIFYNLNVDFVNNNLYFILLIILQFAIIFIFAWYPMPMFFKFLLMTLFSAIWGLIFIRLKKHASEEVIKTAILGVLGIFVGMFLFGLLLVAFGVYLDYRFGLALLGLLLLLIIVSIVLMFMHEYHGVHKGIAIVTIILFSLFIVYDTNNVLYGPSDDPIGSSMDYYLDIMNIFLALVNYQT